MRKLTKVAIIGAGTMGVATALHIALYGYKVILKDISTQALHRAKQEIMNQYRMAAFLNKEYRQVEFEQIIDNITFQVDYAGLIDMDIIIENIDEDYDKKVAEYNRLAKYCTNDALIAINTSCISITKLAACYKRPKQVIGVHLMNPVAVKDVVEVIRGDLTSNDTENAMLKFLKSLAKTPVVIRDRVGFVSNRLSHSFMNEAAHLVHEGVASPIQIDTIIKKGFGHEMGPLETADLIGLDTVINSLNVLHDNYKDPKYQSCPLLVKMVNAGKLGRKSGVGFYNYNRDKMLDD